MQKVSESDTPVQTDVDATPVRAPWSKPEIVIDAPIAETEAGPGTGLDGGGSAVNNLC